MPDLESLGKSVIAGNENEVKESVRIMLESGIEPLKIINEGLIAGMNVIAERFKNGELFIPEVLIAAKAMSAGLEVVKPYLADKDIHNKGTVLIGTVKGDLHDIGKNLVGMMMESNGFKVINLGTDISPEKFVAAAKEHTPDIVAMSAMLTTTMQYMKETIDLIKSEGLNVKCIIGGAPVTQDFAAKIGADGFAPDASSAVELCEKLVGAA